MPKKPKKTKKLKTQLYTVLSDFDTNDSFQVEAISWEEATWKALEELGYHVCKES